MNGWGIGVLREQPSSPDASGASGGRSGPDIRVAAATPDDVPAILSLIQGLGEYERLAHEVVATEERLRETLFGDNPAAEVLMATVGGEPVGFALFFRSYSTFLARSGIYLEDLFVRPAWRGRGVGRRLLAQVARLAVERGCGRLEWAVLDWNEDALRFYRRLGAVPLSDWTVHRVSGSALSALASSGD